jgi:hypothetical protein
MGPCLSITVLHNCVCCVLFSSPDFTSVPAGGIFAAQTATVAVVNVSLVACDIFAAGNSILQGDGGGGYFAVTASQGSVLASSIALTNVTAVSNSLISPNNYAPQSTGGAGFFALLSAEYGNITDRYDRPSTSCSTRYIDCSVAVW